MSAESGNTNETANQANSEPEMGEQVTIKMPDQEEGNYKFVFIKRPMRYDPIMIVFTLIVLAGGIVGYLTKNSTASLVASSVFCLLLALAIYLEGARKSSYLLLASLLALTSMFMYRYSLNGVFVPSGLFGMLSLLMLVRHCFIFYWRRKSNSIQ